MMRQVSHKHIVYLYGVCVRDLESKYPCLLDIGPCGVQVQWPRPRLLAFRLQLRI